MRKKTMFTAVLLATAALCITAGATAGSETTGYPLEDVRIHAKAAAEKMDIPDDRLYAILTYDGEDHLMIANEHKAADRYGVSYIHTLIDTDDVDGYEEHPVNLYFECPICGCHSSSIIDVDDSSTGRLIP